MCLTFLILFFATAFVAGLYFPVAATSYDPYLGYGIVSIIQSYR